MCVAFGITFSLLSEITTVFQHVYGTKRSEQREFLHRKPNRGNYLFQAELPKHAQQQERLDFSTETSLIHLAGFQLTAISVKPLNYLECCNQSASFSLVMKAGSRCCELPSEEDKVKVTVSPAATEKISVAAAFRWQLDDHFIKTRKKTALKAFCLFALSFALLLTGFGKSYYCLYTAGQSVCEKPGATRSYWAKPAPA